MIVISVFLMIPALQLLSKNMRKKYHENISVSFFRILKENNLCADFREERMVRSSTITKAIDAFENEKSRFQEKQYNAVAKSLSAILVKVLEYEEKERICGENRKSYFKTDHDATAMSLKADYYSGSLSAFPDLFECEND